MRNKENAKESEYRRERKVSLNDFLSKSERKGKKISFLLKTKWRIEHNYHPGKGGANLLCNIFITGLANEGKCEKKYVCSSIAQRS